MVFSWGHYIKSNLSCLNVNILIKLFIRLLNHSYSTEKFDCIKRSLKTSLLKRIWTANLKTLCTGLLFEKWSEIEENALVYSKPSFETRVNISVFFMNKESSYCPLTTVKVFVWTPNCTIDLPIMKLKLNWTNCVCTLKDADNVILLASLDYSWYIIKLTSDIIDSTKW